MTTELNKTGGRTICCEIHQLNSVWNKEEFYEDWKELIIVPIQNKDDIIDCSNY